MSLKRVFKFARPKGPGYGIAKGFYLSVLSGHAQLPTPRQIANPKAEDGAVEGFLAPLMEGSTREDLDKPLQRGIYALASKDRKTVIKLVVVSKEEAGFDPEAVARSSMAERISPEALARVRATWTLLQMTFESHDPDVTPALAFLYAGARRMGELTEGVVADPIAQNYMLPEQLPRTAPAGKPQAVDHVTARMLPREAGLHGLTLGLQKFALPEFELQEIAPHDAGPAEAFLLSAAQTLLNGGKVEIGDRIGSRSSPFEVVPGGLDRGLWEGIPCRELIPARGRSVNECLKAWLLDQGRPSF